MNGAGIGTYLIVERSHQSGLPMTRPRPRYRPTRFALWFCLSVLLSALGTAVGADEPASDWSRTQQAAVRLIAATDTVGDGTAVSLGLEFRMEDGWKIYWRSPGDAGYPPRIDWSRSGNLADAEILWPAPKRFSVLGLETVGYEHGVVLPIGARLVDAGKPLEARASVDYLTCSDICIPISAELVLELPAGPARPSAFAPLIGRYLSKVPGDGTSDGLGLGDVHLVESGTEVALRIEATSVRPFSNPDVFIEGPEQLAFDRPRVVLDRSDHVAVLNVGVVGAETLEKPLVGMPITVTLVDGDRGVERRLTAEAVDLSGDMTEDESRISLLTVLALALLGGLILNLMPCVLPVLSIKLLGVVGHGGGESRTVRLSFVASAAGIVFSFMVLAGALVALKATGNSVGWGLQFQQPWFLTTMILVMTLFAANLWGFFEIHLPRTIADAGERASHVRGLGGHFLTGALATLLATPCSAPFLGTAVGFALSRGAGEIFVVFLFLGLGLSIPYLVVAAYPRLATAMPRPGGWMIILRRFLGFALAGTGAWLVSVLAVQVSAASAVAVGGLAIAVAAALSVGRRLSDRYAGFSRFGGAAAAALAALALLVARAPSEIVAKATEGQWVPLDVSSIPGLVADGRIVFVNVTADWCITCRVNESLVLGRSPVRERLAADGVVTMRGDWTLPNEAISDYLARFGRYGIPFDAVYGPGVPDGEALPELLSQEIVLSAFERAAGTAVGTNK